MKERDWGTLIDNIHVGNCILVLGPDVAIDKVGNELKPLTEILSNEFADELEKESKVLNRNDLAYTADLYAEKISEKDLRFETSKFYESHKLESNSIYSDLVNIPFQFIINATPDKLLIQTLENAGKKYQVDYYNYEGKKRGMVQWDKRDIPLIYYLFGMIDDPNSLVISEKNLFEFLVSVISNEPPIQSNISSEFRDKEKCFLFLGFGFRNWYLRILLYVLLGGEEQIKEKKSRSFALEKIIPNEDCNFQQICFLFRKDLKVKFTEMKVDEFVSELKDRYELFSKDKEKPVDEPIIAIDAPTVFICHSEEDTDPALVLYKKLQEGGLDPWIDKEGIRGGNDWDRILVRKIKKSDYFVVLQSKYLNAKKRGYANKEINLALEKQKEILDPSLSFIYPVKIDECELLEELDVRQTIDLTNPDNYEKLISDIKSDYQSSKK